ncbi:MAG: carboxypeptidase regulatory-like domain-containing protein, partial [Sedimentisphaerales bacterium]|nr:carboxypeptidase regulatory-like domain-containing protein [Sedimentisphaerales bacterium]
SDFYVKAPELKRTYKYTTHYQNGCGFEVWRDDIRLVLPQEGKIKGRVIEAQTGNPVEQVELLIQAERDREDILNRYLPISIKTNADGSFVCEGLPEGKNSIELATNEKQTAEWITEPVEVNVSPNKLIDNIEVKVKKGGIVEYTVRQYDTEQPLAGINVSSYGQNFNARSITNAQGTSRQRLLPGEYQGYAGGKGYISWQVNKPVIAKDGETTHVDIGLTKSPIISGTVVDTEGRPSKDIPVTVHPFGDHIYTNKDGKFVAWYDERRTDKGLYIIARDTQNSLTAIVHTMDLKQPVKLSLNPALTVKGKIEDANENGIPATRVTLGTSFANCLSEIGAEVLTDAQGLFEFRAIPPKPDNFNYWVSVHSSGYAPKTYDIITIEGQPGTTVNVGTIQLRPANLTVSGYVEDANGLPEQRAIIILNGRDQIDQPEKVTTTNEQGQFFIKGIAEGPIRLQANYSSSPGGAGFTDAEAGDQNIKIVLGQRLVHTQQARSSAGKSLPDLSNFGIKPENTNDKALLICFFDYQQRPSRNCIMQLSKKAQELAAKDIAVVAVQASKTEQVKLDEWIKENNILILVGIIEADPEIIKYNWGIKSLPWLILTDKKHIVEAEGFSPAEIDEKLNQKNGD